MRTAYGVRLENESVVTLKPHCTLLPCLDIPLHVASMLGHLEFVDDVLTRKLELAKEVDPDICLVSDIDGRNPPHIAAMICHLNLLKELVQATPWAARVLIDQGETILHACVRCNLFEALKLLVERVSDHELLSCKNDDSKTILQLAIVAKQTELVLIADHNALLIPLQPKQPG
ncbi:uncharacterized protein LOC120192682 [Hibiscus syriacus]|uniref:uncharacterized protein LOC120192682 n=1 Tax=Hibiscus syriacus TaxID=106335 RepID=UPI00192278D5|nr:uncharacterized protein LOC120192682 [Hibiscus syriacus]